MQDHSAARKYAHALFAVSQAKNEVRASQQGLEEIVRVARVKTSLLRVLSHPFIALAEKQTMLKSALGEYSTPLLERFLIRLVRNKRIGLIAAIANEFQEEVDRHENTQSLTVRTAYALSEAQQNQLRQKLEAWLRSTIRMTVQVDPSLIGGLVVQTRDHVMDQSLSGQLKKLQGVLS